MRRRDNLKRDSGGLILTWMVLRQCLPLSLAQHMWGRPKMTLEPIIRPMTLSPLVLPLSSDSYWRPALHLQIDESRGAQTGLLGGVSTYSLSRIFISVTDPKWGPKRLMFDDWMIKFGLDSLECEYHFVTVLFTVLHTTLSPQINIKWMNPYTRSANIAWLKDTTDNWDTSLVLPGKEGLPPQGDAVQNGRSTQAEENKMKRSSELNELTVANQFYLLHLLIDNILPLVHNKNNIFLTLNRKTQTADSLFLALVTRDKWFVIAADIMSPRIITDVSWVPLPWVTLSVL